MQTPPRTRSLRPRRPHDFDPGQCRSSVQVCPTRSWPKEWCGASLTSRNPCVRRSSYRSGTPALRRPSKRGSSWVRYVGSSLNAVQAARARERETVNAGLITRPALAVETRLVKATKLRRGGGQQEISLRIVSIGLDRSPTPHNRLHPTGEAELRPARHEHPDVSRHITRTEAQSLADVSLGVFGATDINLAQSDIGMGLG